MNHSAEQFTKAFPEMYNDLYRYLAYRIPNRSDAEDVVASTALLAWKMIHQYNESLGNIEGWVMGIAKNQVRMYWRSHKTHCSLEDVENLLSNVSPSIDYIVNDQITIERIFAELDGEQRALLAMHYIDGIPYNDLAKMLNSKPEQLRQKASRTMRTIRNRFSFFTE